MKVRHIDLYPDEFLAAVAGEMSPTELGVYWMICLLCYARGGMIDADMDWLRAKFRPGRGNRVIAEVVEALIASGKVTRDGHEIGVRRCREEVERALSRIREASENGRRGGRPSKQNNGKAKPSPLNDKKLTTNYQLPIEDSDPDGSGADAPSDPDPTKQLWDRGLAILGVKHRSLLGKMVKRHDKVAVLEAIIETEREQPVDPVAYFVECCRRRGNGRDDQADAYELLARAAIDYDERQSRRGPAKTSH